MLADRYPNYSICGLPYFISRDVPDWRSLAHRTTEELEKAGIEVLVAHKAERIDARNRRLTATTSGGVEADIRFDTLIIATGAEPIRPPVPGVDREGVYQLHTVDDSLALDKSLARGPKSSAVIVGAGYIGLEMAEALHARGIEVTVIEQLPTVLPTVDPPLGSLVREELEANGVQVITHATVTSIDGRDGRLAVVADPDLVVEADIVLMVVGVRPEAKLGQEAGIETGAQGRSG
jgi:NADPH-dependent 2,4-dienoyl-CoA reductase/sulfur reductase-like enzyme